MAGRDDWSERDLKEGLLRLLEANGLREEDLNRPDNITSLEMVLDDYCCMRTLSHFPKLQSVCLIQQDMRKIEGLEQCSELQRLLLNENAIEKIEGLQHCRKLQKLYLPFNCIKEIGDGLAGLENLEVLWLAGNQLSSLQGLCTPNLTELNAASNRLSSVVGALEHLPLKSLNLAGNQLCSFKEILDIARRTELCSLSFADPDFGENPICSLCNYQTYTLYHLPKLQVHDQMHVTAEAHSLAQAAFAKKRLYYNMRIKTLKRQATDCLRAAKVIDEARRRALGEDLEMAARAVRRADACRRSREAVDIDDRDAERRVRLCEVELADADLAMERLAKLLDAELAQQIRSLLLELQSGGNVRFEPGGEDLWVSQIQQLVLSRFRPAEFQGFGFDRIKLGQVIRLHHRSLRLHFDQLVQRLGGDELEHLFYVPKPGNALEELRQVAELGPADFFAEQLAAQRDEPEVAEELEPESEEPLPEEPSEEASPGGASVAESGDSRPVLLTNSLCLAEAGRLHQQSQSKMGQAMARSLQRAQRLRGEEPTGSAGVGSRGVLLICKVHLGEQQVDSPSCFYSNVEDAHGLWHREPSKKKPKGPLPVRSGPVRSLQRSSKEDEQVQVWHVPYVELILPEFLVEFEYLHATEAVKEKLEGDFGPFAQLLAEFRFFGQLGVEESFRAKKRKPADAQDLAKLAQEESDRDTLSCQWMQHVPDLPAVPHLSGSMLSDPSLGITSHSWAELKVLNLHGRQLRRFDADAFQRLHGLETLLLSFNCIESLAVIPACGSLTTLDVAHNLIHKVNALVSFPDLRQLDLSWNQLESQETFAVLGRDVPRLECLMTLGNRLDSRKLAVAKLPCLRTFDGKDVTPEEAQAYRSYERKEINEDFLMHHSFAPPKGSTSARLPGDLGYDPERDRVSLMLSGASAQLGHSVTRANWRLKVLAVDLQGCEVTELRFLANLPECQTLNLSDNELGSLEWLPEMPKLQSLSLERCNLTSLKGLGRCQELQKLEAAGNHLTDALELQKLSKLSEVSLEDNFVDSLDTFASLTSLMELYLSNNVIEDLRSVLLLKQLPKLMVLELSGNDLCKVADYRQYTMFHLRKMKVLDGQPISKAEQHQADEKFSGKVTMELLEDKLGPSPSCYTFRTVDLSGQGIRELGTLLNDDLFPSLRELVLDGNPFSDIRTVGPLSKLLVLRMNKSKLDLENGVTDTAAPAEFHGGLSTLPNLQVMEIGYSGISDMRFFAQFPLQTLRILHLPGNDISKLEGLNHMEQLRELVVDKNKIKQFDEKSFEGLRSLRELRAEDNGLKSLLNLGPLPRLRALYLSVNRIAELSELDRLRHLRHLLVVHMAQNPVARKPQYRLQLLHCVPSARAVDGKEVSTEERERLEQIAMTDSKSNAVYVFNEPPPPNVQVTYMTPPVATVQVPASDSKAAEPRTERRTSQVEFDAPGLKKDRAQSAPRRQSTDGRGR